ncbi:MAG: hypothetical protein IPO07_21180 [Haliscomenobacter sp.]|nr:hypothetical protein [Haliscomenobacter sp.]MBK9491023.1 hypothetical protein [Haliscomenobacter sp.]
MSPSTAFPCPNHKPAPEYCAWLPLFLVDAQMLIGQMPWWLWPARPARVRSIAGQAGVTRWFSIWGANSQIRIPIKTMWHWRTFALGSVLIEQTLSGIQSPPSSQQKVKDDLSWLRFHQMSPKRMMV